MTLSKNDERKVKYCSPECYPRNAQFPTYDFFPFWYLQRLIENKYNKQNFINIIGL